MLSGNLFPRPLVRQGINQLNIFEPLTLGRFYDQKKVRNRWFPRCQARRLWSPARFNSPPGKCRGCGDVALRVAQNYQAVMR